MPIILWLLGVPLSLVIVLWLFGIVWSSSQPPIRRPLRTPDGFACAEPQSKLAVEW